MTGQDVKRSVMDALDDVTFGDGVRDDAANARDILPTCIVLTAEERAALVECFVVTRDNRDNYDEWHGPTCDYRTDHPDFSPCSACRGIALLTERDS